MAGQLSLSLTNRTVRLSSGTTKYLLDAAITQASGGIDPNVFLMRIADGGDTFERVATLQDIASFRAARSEASSMGELLYRISNATLEYEDADVATQAKTAVKEAVDKLVADFNTFLGDPSTTTVEILTGADKTFLESLKTDYNTTNGYIAALEAEEVSVQGEIAVLQEQLTSQRTRVQSLEAARSAMRDAFSAYYQQNITQYQTIEGFGELTSGHLGTVQGYTTDSQAKLSAIDTNLQRFDLILTDERALIDSLYQDLEAKSQQQSRIAADLLEKRRALDTTLTAILQLEPTFSG